MGRMTKKLKRKNQRGQGIAPNQKFEQVLGVGNVIKLGSDYGNKYLTQDEYIQLEADVAAVVADKMMADALLTVMKMLDEDMGKFWKRADRFKKFGAIFREEFKRQSATHSMAYLERLKEANLTSVEYGEGGE